MKPLLDVPEPPKKGADWASWLRWGFTLATILVTWYASWNATEQVKHQVEAVTAATAAK